MSHERLNDHQVLEQVRTLVRRGKIGWTDHVEQRMAERGFERGQLRQCLLAGYFLERPYSPNKSGELEYKFTIGGNVDGETIHVAASLIPEKKVVVITVIDAK